MRFLIGISSMSFVVLLAIGVLWFTKTSQDVQSEVCEITQHFTAGNENRHTDIMTIHGFNECIEFCERVADYLQSSATFPDVSYTCRLTKSVDVVDAKQTRDEQL